MFGLFLVSNAKEMLCGKFGFTTKYSWVMKPIGAESAFSGSYRVINNQKKYLVFNKNLQI